MIELLGGRGSTCCSKVLLTAAEKGLEVTLVPVSVHRHENLAPDYLTLNREGMIPTLRTEGRVLVESSVIMRFLDRRHPDPALTPRDPFEAMRMDLLLKDLDDKYHGATAFISFSEGARDETGELTEAAKTRLKSFDDIPEPGRRAQRRQSILLGLLSDEGRRACGYLETMIKDIDAALYHGPFLAGQTYSLADAALTPYVRRLAVLGCAGLWEDRPRVAEWFQRMRDRPSYAAAFDLHPEREGGEDGSPTWTRFRQALESIGTRPDDPAARLPARRWGPVPG